VSFVDDVAGGGMARPPVARPDLPTLSAMPKGANSSEEGVAARGQAVLQMFHKIDSLVDQLASAVPGQSEALDAIKTRLRDIMTAIVNGGSERAGSGPMGGGTRLEGAARDPGTPS
jgi:DNA-binding PucR family transcriptional regulator